MRGNLDTHGPPDLLINNAEMLQSCFGGSASAYPSPAEWAKITMPFLLKLGPDDNGQPLTVPIRGAND